MENTKSKRILRASILGAVLLAFLVLFTQTLGLFGAGFEQQEVLTQAFFYVSYGVGFLLGILLLFVVELIITKGDSEYGNSLGFASQGEIPGLSYFKKFSNFRLFLGSFIIFSIIGIVVFVAFPTQTTFTGLKVLPQQFTKTQSLAFSGSLIPISENLGAGFFIALLLFALRIVSRKYNWNKGSFVAISIFLIPIIIGIYGIANHQLRYPGSDVALTIVFIFWTLGGLITILTGNIIPFIVMHFDNNFFYEARRLFDKEIMLGVMVTTIILLIVLYLYLYTFRKQKTKDIY